MTLRRLLLVAVLALAASIVLVPGAGAGNFDEQAMGCTGEDPGICPSGTEGVPYTLPVKLQGDEDLGCAVFTVSSGSLPLGLSLTPRPNETKAGYITGTPTQAGTYDFYLTVTYNAEPSCNKPTSDDRFRITINPGVPKLTIGPESAPNGTVGTAYTLQLIASVPDPKTWSINDGALPPGLALDSSTGVISGTPTTAGQFAFQVLAKIDADTRTDTKWLTIVVRDPLVIASEAFATGRREPAEVSVPFEATLSATGGTGEYTWALASGALPPGLAFTDGSISGIPRTAGSFPFAVSATDTEGRVATYAARIVVAPRLVITTRRLPAGRAGRFYQVRFRTLGGMKPVAWRKIGPLPRGMFFDRTSGTLAGTPTRPGRYRLTLQATDAFKVKAQRTFLLRVRPAPRAR